MEKINKKFTNLIVAECLTVFLLWIVSVFISSPIFNRPLDTHHESVTAHTLVSMKALEERGFWNLLGASAITPHSLELQGVDITTFGLDEGIYLSYPSLWLDLPYIVYKALNVLPFGVELSVQYVQIYNLTVNRLLGGLIIYYLFLEIINIFAGSALNGFLKRLIAFLGLVGWMFNPPVMYWTQNVYFSDQTVLMPIYALFLILFKCRFKPENLSVSGRFLLFAVTILACGIDWYGWVSVAVIMLLILADKAMFGKNLRSFRQISGEYLNSIKYMMLGTVIVGMFFLAQLLYFQEGISILYNRFFKRIGRLAFDANGQIVELTYFKLTTTIVLYWTEYYPQIVAYHHIYLVIAAVLITIAFYRFYIKNEDGRILPYVYILLFVTPLIQIFLLKQHSFVHDFSALKMAMPIAFGLFVLPLLLLCLFLKNRLSDDFLKSLRFNATAFIFAAAISSAFIFSAGSGMVKFAGIGTAESQDFGLLIKNIVGTKDLPITENIALSNYGYSLSTKKTWYADRFIYKISDAKKMLETGKFNAPVFRTMTPVFLAFRDDPIDAEVASICEGKWQPLIEKINEREIIACKSDELQRLF